jgi:hypothetical protein
MRLESCHRVLALEIRVPTLVLEWFLLKKAAMEKVSHRAFPRVTTFLGSIVNSSDYTTYWTSLSYQKVRRREAANNPDREGSILISAAFVSDKP